MEQLIKDFPQNISDALAIAKQATITKPQKNITNVVICGMGGSGIGGKIVAEWLQDYAPVPVAVLNDYVLPNYVNAQSLVIGSSYSGNTEETLEALHTANKRDAHIIGICSGGQLQSFCTENGFDYITVPGGNPPRSAIAFSIVQLMHIFHVYGYTPTATFEDLSKSIALLESESTKIHDEAKKIAAHLYGKVGVIYCLNGYEGVAVRARQQFNENAKYLAWHHVIPEMNHNELVGWGGGDNRFAVLALLSDDCHPKNKQRYSINKPVIEAKSGTIFEVWATGDSKVIRSIYFIHLVDWASYYLCQLNKADIMDIGVIDYLKEALSKQN